MVWFSFNRDFDFNTHGGRVTTAYKAGMVRNVTSDCADQAAAAGAGRKVKSPKAGRSAKPDAGSTGPGISD